MKSKSKEIIKLVFTEYLNLTEYSNPSEYYVWVNGEYQYNKDLFFSVMILYERG